MKYKGYKLDFTTAVHFGNGSLEDAESRLYADTIFSALCHEAVLTDDIDRLIEYVNEGKIRISDAFPYNKETYYIPKPVIAIDSDGSSAIIKKKAKSMEFIPADKLDEYLSETLDIATESDKQKNMGTSEIRTRVSVSDREKTDMYFVGSFAFNDGWGIYLIIGYENEEELYLVEDLMIALEFSGIGGERSSGMGRFVLKNANIPDELEKNLVINSENTVMSLSIGMCSDDDLENVCNGAHYLMQKRSGFISSASYAGRNIRKQDYYCFKSGSVFNGSFEGVLKDVSIKGDHPVYRYALPIFMEIKKYD